MCPPLRSLCHRCCRERRRRHNFYHLSISAVFRYISSGVFAVLFLLLLLLPPAACRYPWKYRYIFFFPFIMTMHNVKKTIIFYCGVLSRSISISFICPFVLSANPIDFCIFCVCVSASVLGSIYLCIIALLLLHQTEFHSRWLEINRTLYIGIFAVFFLLTRAITL